MTEKGYAYTVEDGRLVEYMKLSTGEKLIWLEEINMITEMTLSAEQKKIRDKLRAAEI